MSQDINANATDIATQLEDLVTIDELTAKLLRQHLRPTIIHGYSPLEHHEYAEPSTEEIETLLAQVREIMFPTDEITASTTRDEITAHLDAADVSYTLDQECEGIRVELPSGRLVIFRHAAHEGEGVANLWGWCLTGEDTDSDGLDTFSELDKLLDSEA